jgi:acetyltransferase
MDTTFSKIRSLPGRIGFVSQSGALGQVIIEYARDLGLGFSMFASVGNKADISGNDLLRYWQDDPSVELILLYMENFGDPRTFTQIARQITKKKPIICVKSGRTTPGARAVSSHTGALANLDVGVDALFDQCGVLRVDSIEEMFDLALALYNQPIPKNNKVAIITNAGGPAILATDACVNWGLEVPRLKEATKRFLRQHLPEQAAVENPIDLIASAGPERYRVALEAVMKDDSIGSVLAIFVPPVMIDPKAIIDVIVEVRKRYEKTLLTCFMGPAEVIHGSEGLLQNKIPMYIFPEAAAKALADMVKYRKWVERKPGKMGKYPGDRLKVSDIIEKSLEAGKTRLVGEEALELFRAYRIPIAEYALATKQSEAVSKAEKLGYPLVMKINKPEVLHKTDIGGVSVDIRNAKEVKIAYTKLLKSLSRGKRKQKVTEILLQQMVKGGVETVFGMTQDPSFGPLMMFGLGGIYVEVMKDVSFKIHPLTDKDAEEMIQSVRGYPLLTGFRGSKPVNMEVLKEILLRLSQLVGDFPEIEQFDINPFFASPEKSECRAVDARVILKARNTTQDRE